jgi:hypothetical protein
MSFRLLLSLMTKHPSSSSIGEGSEEFGVMLNSKHPLASYSDIDIDIDALRCERWLRRIYYEHLEQLMSLIRSHDLDVDQGYELTSETRSDHLT